MPGGRAGSRDSNIRGPKQAGPVLAHTSTLKSAVAITTEWRPFGATLSIGWSHAIALDGSTSNLEKHDRRFAFTNRRLESPFLNRLGVANGRRRRYKPNSAVAVSDQLK
jgi:hypothetical protein